MKDKREIIFTHTKNEIIKKYKISEAFLSKSEVKKLNNDNTDTIGIFLDGAHLRVAEKEFMLRGPEDLCNEINKFTKKKL